MVTTAIRFASLLALVGAFFHGCAQVKETGRTIGQTTRDVTTEIGHGTRDAVRPFGEGTKAAADQVKKVVRPERESSQY